MGMIEPILMEMEMEAKTTRRVLERVPEDKLSWRPHSKSMSLGTLALHLASLPAAIAKLCQVDLESPPTFQPPEAASREEILTAHDQSQAAAREELAKMDDAFLVQIWSMKRDGQTIMAVPRIGFLRSVLLNHSYHHRGQLSVYLRLLDVPVPSIYGPSADESPFG